MCAQSSLVAKLAAAFANSSRGVVSAYLHGSYAEGREHGKSDVDVVILNDAPAPLARHVVLDGIRAFCRNEETDHAFRREFQLRAADLAPFLHRMRRTKLDTLRE